MPVVKKRKVSVSLDDAVVAELESTGEALSTQVNEVLQFEVERRRRHRLLTEALDELEAVHGPPDESTVQHYLQLLQ